MSAKHMKAIISGTDLVQPSSGSLVRRDVDRRQFLPDGTNAVPLTRI